MTDDVTTGASMFANQRRTVAMLFAVLCVALIAGYYLFLRTDYAVLYTDMKPAEASAIVTELDAKGIPHRLADGGTTILVPTTQTDNVRLAVAGSDIPMKGSVGFELFNKSDMGLTDFAQKINYQRALQGELARTIMMMDGIESARIHLAIPERSLFRGNRSTPKAAVEVLAKVGRPLTPERIAGIQQLVASAVPDLVLGDVVVLDGDGRIVSEARVTQAMPNADVEEQTAAQNYYSARAKAAIAKLLPGLQFNVRTLVLAGDPGSEIADRPSTDSAGPLQAPRNFRLRVTVLSLTALNAEDQGMIRTAVEAAVGLNEPKGDSLAFEVGPTSPPLPAPAIVSTVPASADLTGNTMSGTSAPGVGTRIPWEMLALALLVTGLLVLLVSRVRGAGISARERQAFVGRIRRQLGVAEVDDARR